MSGSFLEIPKILQRVSSPNRLSNKKVRQSIGASPITGSMQDRYKQLINEFEQIDKDGNKRLTYKEIHDFLSKQQGSSFDENLCKDIFARMDKNHDSIVSIDEFLWSFIEAENILKGNIRDIKKNLVDNYKKMEEFQKKLVQARASEIYNRYGIMKGSILTVDVIEAKDLVPMDTNGLSDPYVILECESQRVQSKYIPETLNPVWKEEFTFEIESNSAVLKVVVMDRDALLSDDYEGEVEIPLSILKDQMKYDQYFPLKNIDGSKKGEKTLENPKEYYGKIHLSLQWIWSKVKYLEDIIQQWKDILAVDQKELQALEDQLTKLKKPFSHLEQQSDWNIREERSFSANVPVYEPNFISNIDGYAEKNVFIYFDSRITRNIVALIYIFISIIVMFARPDFVNVFFR